MISYSFFYFYDKLKLLKYMKQVLWSIPLLFLSFIGTAQVKIGGEVIGGVSLLGIRSTFTNGASFERFVNPISWGLRGIIDYKISDDVSLISGLGIVNKGVGISYLDGGDTSSFAVLGEAFNRNLRYNCVYLNLPITASYTYDLFDDPNMLPFILGGVVLDYRIGNCRPQSNGINQELDFDYHSPLDLSIAFGVGIEVKTRSNNYVTISLAFYKGVLDNVTDSYGDAQEFIRLRNNQVLLSLALKFDDLFEKKETGLEGLPEF